jgi:NADH:ubiquinone reductase (H+-translocating)
VNVVILGGGFAGIATAERLERLLRPAEASISLVSQENYSLFTPMLPEVSSGELEPRHVVTPVRAQLHRTRFYLGQVMRVDLDARAVEVEHRLLGTRQTVPYEHLVLALGSVTSTFGIPGVEERSLALKTLDDADRLRNHVVAMLEVADVATDPAERERLLTFVFVGGGFTGVEAAGEMVDFLRSVNRFYRTIRPHDICVVLVEGGSKLLPDLQPGMGEYAERALRGRGVEVVLGRMVTALDADGLHVAGGRCLRSATVVWSAGVRPSPLLAALPLETRRGAIVVNPDMSVPGRPGLWALGDCAAVPDPSGTTYPGTAQHAIREGPVLAENIVAKMRGNPTKPNRYRTIGMMASLGGRRGVAGLWGRYLLTGFPAWFLWRTYYLLRLPGWDRRTRVAFDWTLDLIFARDIAELRMSSRTGRIEAEEVVKAPEHPRNVRPPARRRAPRRG